MKRENELKDLSKAVASYPSIKSAARGLRIPESTLRRRLRDCQASGSAGKMKAGKERSGLSRRDFLAQFDVETRTRNAIRVGLKQLTADSIVKDSEFRIQICREGSAACWRTVSEEQEFAENQFICDGRTWWASKATVQWVLGNVSKARALA